MSGGAASEMQTRKGGMDRRVWARAIAVLVLLGVIIAMRKHFHLSEYFSRENVSSTLEGIKAWVAGFGFWGPAVFTLLCAATTIIHCPVVIVVFVAVTLFGPFWGFIVSMLVLALGASLVHGVAHWLGRPLVEKLFGKRMRDMEARITQRELLNVTMLRLVLFMNPLLNWALGISGVRYRNVLLGTMIGVAPGILVLVWLSGELLNFVTTGSSFNPLKYPQLLIPLVIAVVLFRSRWFFDRFDKMRGTTAETAAPADDGNAS